MIKYTFENMLNFSDCLLIIGISILVAFVVFLFVFNKSPKKTLFRFWGVLSTFMVINSILFLILFPLFSNFLEPKAINLGPIFFILVIVCTVLFNLNLILKLKMLLPKSRKTGDLYEISKIEFNENRHRALDLLVTFALILLPMCFLGNENMEYILICIFAIVLICSLSSVFLFARLLKIFDKIFK